MSEYRPALDTQYWVLENIAASTEIRSCCDALINADTIEQRAEIAQRLHVEAQRLLDRNAGFRLGERAKSTTCKAVYVNTY